MSQNFFSPNSKITGGALFISLNEKDESIFFRFIRQIAFSQDKKGNFDGKNPIVVKINTDEASDIIRAIRNKDKASFFHKTEENQTSGYLSYYKIDSGKKDEHGNVMHREGYGFVVKRNDFQIKVGLNQGSAERLSQYLSWALAKTFESNHKEDLKQFAERNKNKENPSAKIPDIQVEPPLKFAGESQTTKDKDDVDF